MSWFSINTKLKSGAVSVGAWMSIDQVSVAATLAASGFEWIVIDLGDAAADVPKVLKLVLAIERGGVVPIVRLAWTDPAQRRAFSECGGVGAVISTARSASETEAAMAAVGRGAVQAPDDAPGPSSAPLCLVEVDHSDGVERIEEILSVRGVGGVLVRPLELAASLGHAGRADHPESARAVEDFAVTTPFC